MALPVGTVHLRETSPCIIQGELNGDFSFDYNFEGKAVRIRYVKIEGMELDGQAPSTMCVLRMYDREANGVALATLQPSSMSAIPSGMGRMIESHLQCCMNFQRGSYLYVGNSGNMPISFLVMYEPLE